VGGKQTGEQGDEREEGWSRYPGTGGENAKGRAGKTALGNRFEERGPPADTEKDSLATVKRARLEIKVPPVPGESDQGRKEGGKPWRHKSPETYESGKTGPSVKKLRKEDQGKPYQEGPNSKTTKGSVKGEGVGGG